MAVTRGNAMEPVSLFGIVLGGQFLLIGGYGVYCWFERRVQ